MSLWWEVFSQELSQRHHSLDEMKAMMYQVDPYCAGCEWRGPVHFLEVDHILPISKGGTDDPSNLQLLCRSCNAIKGDRDMRYLQETLRKRGEEDPDRVDFPLIASSLWLSIEESDDGHFVLTNVIGGGPIPFDEHVLIDGESYMCEVRRFSRTYWDDLDEESKTYRFYGLALPYQVFDGVRERSARVKVEYSIVARAAGKVVRYSPFSFYWRRDSPTSPPDTFCDLLKPSEDPSKHPIEYKARR